jgi:hypothetical protein
MTFPTRLAAALLVVTAMVAIPRSAHASCVEPPPVAEHLRQAEVVFAMS